MKNNPAKIHPLAQTYLEAYKAESAAYETYIAEIRAQFGAKANAFTQSSDLYNASTLSARAAFYLAQDKAAAALLEMRKAGATVNPS